MLVAPMPHHYWTDGIIKEKMITHLSRYTIAFNYKVNKKEMSFKTFGDIDSTEHL